MMRILFIGETWQGSSARSLREALSGQDGMTVRDIGEDTFIPAHRHFPLRAANRVLRRFQRHELERAILLATGEFKPDAVVVYKGTHISAALVSQIQTLGSAVVNVFPDYSPHAYGAQLHDALGMYDLAISTKPFHPPLWGAEYGYRNRCVFVPHGYDPSVHYWHSPPTSHVYDVALCSTWRPEYHRLMRKFAEVLDDRGVSVAIAGSGWSDHTDDLPAHWQVFGARSGRSYGEFVRSAKIAIAPVNRTVVINGIEQHGDEDTTRTYELAAAHCFFLHQRTDYVSTIYDEHTEVPFWNDGSELALLVRRWLADPAGRRAMAGRAHTRAVPAYSIPQRALSVRRHVEALIETRAPAGMSR